MTPLKDAISLLDHLIAFPTVSTEPNLAMIDWLAERLETAGAEVEVMSNAEGSKANLWATLNPGEGGIVLSGHTDVVPVADQDWTSDPFVLTSRDERLFGRGTCDMKGFIAACIASLPALRESRRPIHFAFTHDEETGCLGAQDLVTNLRLRGIAPAMALIGEPTSMRVIEGHKGCCEYTTRFTGLEGHGSAPDAGVNAVEYAVRYVTRLMALREELKGRAPAKSPFDPPWTTANVGAIRGGVAHNVIVGKAEVDWEFRPVQDSDFTFVKDSLAEYVETELLPAMRAVHPAATIETETIGEVAGLMPMDENAARDLVFRLTGQNSSDVVAFGTEAGLFQSLGCHVVVCGPGSIEQAHKPDEYLDIPQLGACLDMLGRLAGEVG